jgi:hypothetical protein
MGRNCRRRKDFPISPIGAGKEFVKNYAKTEFLPFSELTIVI